MNRIIYSFFIIILLTTSLYSFGQNKVQYVTFQWEVIKTPHFDIYYNKGQKLLAEQTALLLEDACAKISDNLRFELTRVIPIIIYNSHNDFEQSNVILEMISEGTGGFTEVFKTRVVVPFTGSYGEYQHVLHHELTHAFQFNILLGGFWESLFTRQFMYMPPLWFIEGTSEYESLGWNDEVDLILRDATINNMLVPLERLENVYDLNGYEYYLIYKEGQGFLCYLSDKYGKYKVGEILKTFQKTRDFYTTFKAIIGKSHYDVNKDWFRYLRKKYWPLVKDKKEPSEIGKKLSDHLTLGSFYNTKPVWSPDGKKIAILSDRHIFMNIILINADTGKEIDTLVKSGTRSDYEEMNPKENALSWSYDGRYLVFISKSGQYDKINIYDFKKKKVIKRINPKLDALSSPDISTDNKQIVFSGTKNGKNDLYLIDFNGKKIQKLTDDLYFDSYPVWNKTDDYIIFTSNRDKGYLSKNNDIFIYSLATKKITKIVSSSNNNFSAQIDRKDNRLIFVSQKDSYANLYIKNLYNFSNINKLIHVPEYQVTDVITGVFDPYFSPDGKKLVFTSYYKMGYDIYTMSLPEKKSNQNFVQSTTNNIPKKDQVEAMAFNLSDAKKDILKFNLTPDWIMGGLLYSSASGFGGFTYLGFSDILGNHRFSLATDFLSGNNDFNMQLLYYYLAHRINYGIGVFHYKDYYYNFTYDQYGYTFDLFYLRRYGVDLIASYPFSKFFRMDLDYLVMKYIRQGDVEGIDNVDANLNIASLSFVHDTIIWGPTGPARGFRGRTFFQKSLALTGHDWLFEMAFIDLRQYFLMSKKYTFAIRGEYGSVWGRDSNENKFYIGGFNSIRGHRYLEYSGTRMFLFNLEYHYPFINVIQIAWPFTFNLSNFHAIFFWDFGSAWDNTQKWQMGHRVDGHYKFKDLKSGLGWGIRFGFYVFQFKLDFATPWDGSTVLQLSKWQGLFSLGYDF